MKKEKIEYYCPKCKRMVELDETSGESVDVFSFGVLRSQEGRWERYHNKCGTQTVQLRRRKKEKKNV